MRLDIARTRPWLDAERYWASMDAATRDIDAPLGAISRPALAANAHDLLTRAAGTPIRVASKSVRVRAVLEAVLALPGYRGVLAYSLPEALWLTDPPAGTPVEDVVVGYPTTHRRGLRALAASAEATRRITLMVDSVDQIDAIDAIVPPSQREAIRLCIEIDLSWESRMLGHIGAWRSPLRSPEQAAAFAEVIAGRPGFDLVGIMGYESQVAGLVDDAPGQRGRSALVRRVKRRCVPELAERRAQIVALVRRIADLEFVNGGGTGSIESTVAEDAVTEVAAGSGLFGPHLFDHYRGFSPAPAAAFALEVARKPRPEIATLLGAGWIASGIPGPDRAPLPVWPSGLALVPREMAGEVQTPLSGAESLRIGDRVWLRHTKAGELSEHLDRFAVVDDDRVVDTVPTYRGEGRAFS